MDYKAWYQMCWQVIVFPLLWYPWLKLCEWLLLVDFLEKPGVIRIIGNIRINALTFSFWCIVGLFVIITSILKLKYIKATSMKIIYLTTMILYVIVMIPFLTSTMLWRQPEL